MIRQQFNPDSRKYLIIGSICLIILVYLAQLFYIQVINNDYKIMADNNAFLKRTLRPSRGMFYDRNDKLLVFNQPAYDLTVVMKEVQSFDTLGFCNIVNVSKEYLIKRLSDIKNRKINPGYSPYLPQIVLTQLGAKEFGILQEFSYKFPGFYIENQPVRKYNYPNAAHLLGYIAPADRQNIYDDNYYSQGDYIGKSGVERSFETFLRGEKGIEVLLRDSHGQIKGKYEDGIYDKNPVPGKNLTLSIDIELQQYGEELMQNKVGTIVMIEPSTGELLCMVVKPDYDPSLFVGRQFRENYIRLLNDPLKPLINRALSGMYPPGSTFKTVQGLTFLEENIITPQTMFTCYHGFPLGNGKPKCHGHYSPLSLAPALVTSCNSFFCWGLKNMLENRKYGNSHNALDRWNELMLNQGLGRKLGIDLPGEKGGFMPNSQYYNKRYKGDWNFFTVKSIAIGQGDVLATPIQICNVAVQIANKGYYYTPHAVKKIKDEVLDTLYIKKRYTGIDPSHYETIIESMRQAVTDGTCRGAWMPDIDICGKTGTVENPGIKDHSVFIGFAPKENPRVAIAVYMENGGFGAEFAVPMGRLMIEKYLRGNISEWSKGYEYNVKNNISSARRKTVEEDAIQEDQHLENN